MGFEQLAVLRDRLRAERQQSLNGRREGSNQVAASSTRYRKKDLTAEAIWRLQKHFPLALPVSPAPKVPLKEGILKDAEQHLQLLGLTSEQLKLGFAAWCQGARYWLSMIEGAPRVTLNGEAAGSVTASQALHAKRQATQQRNQARRNQSKQKNQPSKASTDATGL